MTSIIPMFFLIIAGDPSPPVRHVTHHISRLVRKLPSGSIRDGLVVALMDKETRTVLGPILKQLREAEEETKRMKQKVKEADRLFRKMERDQRNPDFPNYEDYGPKPKKPVDG
jgi:hypothetical protein